MAHDETKSVPSRSQPGDKVRVKHGVRDPDFPDIPWAAGRGRSRRLPRRERRARPNDDLVEAAESFLPQILMFYRRFGDKRPVMLLELPSLKIYVYPYREFKDDLSERSQAM